MSESTMSDARFFRMFYIMIAAMVALTVLLAVIAYLIGGESDAQRSRARQTDNKATLTERVAPYGGMNVGSAATTAVAGAAAAAPPVVDGKATYDSACAACHATGVAGAPKLGDATSWKERIAKGKDALYQNALNGFQGKAGMMPAKGGNPALADAAVQAAVDHIVRDRNKTEFVIRDSDW
jgi:cytochrome c5